MSAQTRLLIADDSDSVRGAIRTVGASLKGIHFRRFGVGHLARRRVQNTPVRARCCLRASSLDF